MRFNLRSILATVALFAASFACAPVAPAQTLPEAPAAVTLSASSDALAIHYNGEWSAGTIVTESFDFLDFGSTKGNHLYLIGNEFLAPTPGFSLYTGGVKVEPNLASLLSKTNLPASNFGVFLDASIGSGIPSGGASHIAWLAGGGVKYAITSNLTWQSLQAQYGGIGAQRVVGLSTGLSFAFVK